MADVKTANPKRRTRLKQRQHTVITFADGGQDFTRWTIDADGRILACEPFQHEIWSKWTVLTKRFKVGKHVRIKKGEEELVIKYAIESVHKYTPIIVEIPSREQHEGYDGYKVRIDIGEKCFVCNAPREITSLESGLSYDGSRRMSADMYTNKCGCIEKYSLLRQKAIPVPRTTPTTLEIRNQNEKKNDE